MGYTHDVHNDFCYVYLVYDSVGPDSNTISVLSASQPSGTHRDGLFAEGVDCRFCTAANLGWKLLKFLGNGRVK